MPVGQRFRNIAAAAGFGPGDAEKLADSVEIVSGNGEATSRECLLFKKTGIADNTATAIITVTIPNAAHAACLRLLFLSSNGGADTFESSRTAQGLVVFQRSAGAVAVATAATIADGQIATDATGGSATHTLAYAVSAVTGAATAVNTFNITVTLDTSGSTVAQIVVFAELINSEPNGVTALAV